MLNNDSTALKSGLHSKLERPVFIVSAPRAGTTLLFNLLARSPDLWTVSGASNTLIESIPALNPAARQFHSNRLLAADATPELSVELKQKLLQHLHDRDNAVPPASAGTLRLLEKTPKNVLRIPFLNAIFPDALFIYLYRDPSENIASILSAWRSGTFVTYPQLPGWNGPPWSLLLIPEWKALQGKPLANIAAAQWIVANQYILDDLDEISPERWCAVTYADLAADPKGQLARLCKFVGVASAPEMNLALFPPAPDAWKAFSAEIEAELPRVQPVVDRVREIVAEYAPTASTYRAQQNASGDNRLRVPLQIVPTPSEIKQEPKMENGTQDQQAPSADQSGQAPQEGATAAPITEASFSSVHTTSFPPLLAQLQSSLLVSTYQAGKLIAVRALDGQLNTHFRNFVSPMGMAGDGRRLALGTSTQIWEFRNQPDVTEKLEPKGRHDACYLPRSIHFTGDIRVHEIAWAQDELWIVNTRFSCLCTLDHPHSFVPRWRPKFVTALFPDDRCHLNGLAIVDNQPRYVTALGQTDKPAGWRDNKANGGILIDVPSGEIISSGLSMPHSPRWYANRLWLLESGQGRLSTVDMKTGRPQTVAELPGFTRGLDFCGPYAFIGLSQVRESAVFSGIPITEKQKERICGVWVVDIRNGQTVAFLRFDGIVQEIFAVQVLSGIRFPELINDDEKLIENSFVVPDEALKDVPKIEKSA